MRLKFSYFNEDFQLESGENLQGIKIAYQTWGKLNPKKNNVVWVCHALTGNSNVFEWWPGLFGENQLFNPDDYFIICANVLGSHYGSSGPLTIQKDGNKLHHNFPAITPLDLINAHELLRSDLGIEKIDFLIGASLGGQQALQWSVSYPERIKKLALVATNAKHSPYGIAFNESQRLALKSDDSFKFSYDEAGKNGLIAARSIAMLSYRSPSGYKLTQSEEVNEKQDDFKAASYQKYQGEKFASRFNAYSYWTLSKTMDAHNIFRNHENAFERISAKTLCIGITTDILFPVGEQKYLNSNIEDSIYAEISSEFGHDGFLVEGEKLELIIKDFIEEKTTKYKPTIFKSKKIKVA